MTKATRVYNYKYVLDRVMLPFSEVLERQEGVLSHGQAIGAGLSRHVIAGRLASGQWQRLYRGVFATFSGPVPRHAQLWGAVLRAGDRAALSHHTAAELWGLADEPVERIHVSVPRDTGALDVPGLIVHYSSRVTQARHPVRLPAQTRVEETALDLAELARTAEDAMAWPIRACQRRLTTPDRIVAALEERGRARWRRDIAEGVADVPAGVHSPLELRYLRDVERKHGLPRGDRQVAVFRGVSRQYIDVRYSDYGVVVELDGVLAHSAESRSRDAQRDNANALDGYQTLRYSWVSVAYHACTTACEVYSLLRRNGLRTPLRPCVASCPAARIG